MSPLWRDEVAIHASPRRLALVRRARGVRPRVVAATELAVPAGPPGDVGQVLDRLADVMADATWHGAAARVVVADGPWVRYGIVPWSATRLDAEGRLAHARHVLGNAHGEAVADWAISLADTPPGSAYVACAMPAPLRAGLEDALAPARLALVSLQPQMVVAFDAWRHRLPADDAWFVSVEDESLAAVHLAGGAWDRVHVARLSGDWVVELERLQAYGRFTRAGAGPAAMFVDAPAWMRAAAGSPAGIEWLEEGKGKRGALDLALLRRTYP